jgi:hypothetical protein
MLPFFSEAGVEVEEASSDFGFLEADFVAKALKRLLVRAL